MDETYQFVNTLLYESDEGAVSINVVMIRIMKQCGPLKKLWLNCLMWTVRLLQNI